MNIVISAQEPELDGPIDVRFGRASYFILLDLESGKWEACANPAVSQSGGAGVAAAQFVIDRKAEVAISGDFGPNANRALKAAGVKMHTFTADTSSVRSAFDLYKQGGLPQFD